MVFPFSPKIMYEMKFLLLGGYLCQYVDCMVVLIVNTKIYESKMY